MSSSDAARFRHPASLRRLAAVGLLLTLAVAAGCTARPMYGDLSSTSAIGQTGAAQLASVEIKPVSDRVGQEVRNHLIFMFAGGAGQPANPAYSLALTTRSRSTSALSVSTSDVSVPPTAGFVSVQAYYRLTETGTGELISAGTRSVQAPYDIPTQNYAAQRAVRDAENRAAREVAELLRMVVAQELEKATSTSMPQLVSSPEEIDRRQLDPESDIFRPLN